MVLRLMARLPNRPPELEMNGRPKDEFFNVVFI